MADGWYSHGRSAFAGGDVDWVNDTITAVLIDTNAYSVNLISDKYLTDIPDAAVLAAARLSGKSIANGGILDADDVTFVSVPTGNDGGAVVLYRDSGAEASSPLVLYLDSLIGLPVTPTGGDIVITWNNNENRIAKL